MQIPPETWVSIGSNVAALVVFLGMVWWRLNRIELAMKEHKTEHAVIEQRLDNHGNRLAILDKQVEG